MSGYVAMVRMDGPVEVGLLERMTEFMTFRGPDARNIWSQGPAGLGHTQLRTTWEDATDRQPLSLDGKRWLVADARIDGRRNLIAELRSRGRIVEESCPDSHLILAAHAVWGEQCVDHLLGDFAFVIWDAETQTLFGARDQMGLKVLYYAEVAGTLLVSNTVGALRLHPRISNEIDEYALGDQFLFERNFHHDRTFFRHIRQLPPAHMLIWRGGKLATRRYWKLPIDEPLNYRREEEYQEQFLSIFGEAVKDRLRFGRVAFTMSGGMDSTSVVAMAKQVNPEGWMGFKSFCTIFEKVICDNEGSFAAIAADSLGVPITFFAGDAFCTLAASERAIPSRSAPLEPFDVCAREFNAEIAAFSRVVLGGNGADPAFYVTKVFDVRPFSRIGRHLPAILKMVKNGNQPPLGLKSRLLARVGKGTSADLRPLTCLRKEFVDRIGLVERAGQFEMAHCAGVHPMRPAAYAHFTNPFWSGGLGWGSDPEVTGLPLEYRQPFLDLRLIRYLLRVPPWPHFFHKRLLRNSMRGKIPNQIVDRPKTPLKGWNTATFLQADDRYEEYIRQDMPGLRLLEPWAKGAELSGLVERNLLDRNRLSALDNNSVEYSLAMLSLSRWLAYLTKTI